ncbi:MAG: hypothetical protein JOY64_08675 [Alphaproteobacteria bacterium]|nr:hypothetical protein [Alphaproteobacteria bacterium]MBV8407690.1 hypothetical protein [Alphaproteobacteria bacterium]
MIRCVHFWTDRRPAVAFEEGYIPSYGANLIEDVAFTKGARADTAKVLEIENI